MRRPVKDHDWDHAGTRGSWDERILRLPSHGAEVERPFDFTPEQIDERRARRLRETYERMGF